MKHWLLILSLAACTKEAQYGIKDHTTQPVHHGIGIVIGLNRVNPSRYDGTWSGACSACQEDGKDIAALLTRQGLRDAVTDGNIKPVLGPDATSEALRQRITAAKRLHHDDVLVIYYSGHGMQVTDTNGDEPLRKDDTWALYDGNLIDDTMRWWLSELDDGVRVLVISDSCTSGSVTSITTMNTRIPARVIDAWFGKPKTPAKDVQDNVQEQHKEEYRDAQAAAAPHRLLRANVILLSAAADGELARDATLTQRNSVYTTALLQAWEHDRSKIHTIKELCDNIASRLPKQPPPPYNQTPQYRIEDPRNPHFEESTPFTIPQ